MAWAWPFFFISTWFSILLDDDIVGMMIHVTHFDKKKKKMILAFSRVKNERERGKLYFDLKLKLWNSINNLPIYIAWIL